MSYFLDLKDYVDDQIVENFLTRQGYIVKDVPVTFRVQYARSNGMGLEPTGEWTTETRNYRLAIPEETPDIEITQENFGYYLAGATFQKIVFQKIILLATI